MMEVSFTSTYHLRMEQLDSRWPSKRELPSSIPSSFTSLFSLICVAFIMDKDDRVG